MRNIRGPLKIVLEIFFQSIAKLLPGLRHSPIYKYSKKKKTTQAFTWKILLANTKDPQTKIDGEK